METWGAKVLPPALGHRPPKIDVMMRHALPCPQGLGPGKSIALRLLRRMGSLGGEGASEGHFLSMFKLSRVAIKIRRFATDCADLLSHWPGNDCNSPSRFKDILFGGMTPPRKIVDKPELKKAQVIDLLVWKH